jgi:hypothetical protein
MPALSRFTESLWTLDTVHEMHEFLSFTSGQAGLTALAADAGATAGVIAGRGGILGLVSGAVANNEVGVWTTNAMYALAADKPLSYRTLVKLQEGGANTANVLFGFASNAGADLLLDAGGGPRTTGTILAVYKNSGDANWRAIAQNGSSKMLSATTNPVGGAITQDVQIFILDNDGTTAKFGFAVNGEKLRDPVTGQPLRLSVPIAGAAALQMVCYLKAGSASGDAVQVDAMYGAQRR